MDSSLVNLKAEEGGDDKTGDDDTETDDLTPLSYNKDGSVSASVKLDKY
jgi:hypothetical protein